MTIPKEIIEKAIECGWHKDEQPNIEINNDGLWVNFWGGGDTRTLHESDIILDPLFWQALGKALGWDFANVKGKDGYREYLYGSEWEDSAHELLSLILTSAPEKEIEAYWNNLLKL